MKLLPALLALAFTSCVVAVKSPQPGDPPPPAPAHRPPPPNPHGAPPVPAGVPVYDAKKELKYDAAVDDCYEAARKTLGILNLTESDLDKKSGLIIGSRGSIFARCSMYRKNHHTYVTFYFRVHGHGAKANIPAEFCENSHKDLGKRVKEQGR